MSNDALSIRFEIATDMDSSDDESVVARPALLLSTATVEQLVETGITRKQATALVTRKRALTSWNAVYTTLKSSKAVTLLKNASCKELKKKFLFSVFLCFCVFVFLCFCVFVLMLENTKSKTPSSRIMSSSSCSSSSSPYSPNNKKRSADDDSLLPPGKCANNDVATLNKTVALIDSLVAADNKTLPVSGDRTLSCKLLAKVLHALLGFKCDGKVIYTVDMTHGFIWSPDTAPLVAALEDHVMRALKQISTRITVSDDKSVVSGGDGDLFQRTMRAIRDDRLVNKVLAACQKYGPAQEAGFAMTLDTNTRLLACTDGIVDLTSGSAVFRAGTPADRIGLTCGHALSELMQKTVEELQRDEHLTPMLALIEKAFPDADQLRAFMCMLANVVRGERGANYFFYVLHGGGRDFKSKAASLLMAMLGAYVAPASITLLTHEPPSSEKPRADLFALRGKRLLLLSEASDKKMLRADTIKRMLGDDPVAVRAPHSSETVSLTLTAHMLVTTNALPRLNATWADHAALVERLRLFHFPVRFFQSANEVEYDSCNRYHAVGISADTLLSKIKIAAAPLLAYLLKQPSESTACRCDPIGTLPSAAEETKRYVITQARNTVLLWYEMVRKAGQLTRANDSVASVEDMYGHFLQVQKTLNNLVRQRHKADVERDEFIERVSRLTGVQVSRGPMSPDGTYHAKAVWRSLVWTS